MSSKDRSGAPVDPVIDTDPQVSPDAIPPVPPLPEVSPTAGVDELRQLLVEFSTSMYKTVAALPRAVRSLDSRTSLLRRLLIAFVITLVLDIGLTFVVAYVTHNQGRTQAQIKATAAQLQTVVGQLDHVVHGNCFVLGIALPNYHQGDSPQRQSYPGGPAAYDRLYIGMQGWSDELGCGIAHIVPGT